MHAPSLDDIVRLGPDQVSTTLDGEVVILGMATNDYFGLEGAGAEIWRMLKGPVTIREMCARLVAEYDVEPERCEREVLTLVRQLVENGLVRVDDAGR